VYVYTFMCLVVVVNVVRGGAFCNRSLHYYNDNLLLLFTLSIKLDLKSLLTSYHSITYLTPFASRRKSLAQQESKPFRPSTQLFY
jgi:hypothetical protein